MLKCINDQKESQELRKGLKISECVPLQAAKLSFSKLLEFCTFRNITIVNTNNPAVITDTWILYHPSQEPHICLERPLTNNILCVSIVLCKSLQIKYRYYFLILAFIVRPCLMNETDCKNCKVRSPSQPCLIERNGL